MEANELDHHTSADSDTTGARSPPLSYSQLFSFQVLYASSGHGHAGNAEQSGNTNMFNSSPSLQDIKKEEYRRGILEIDFFMETICVHERDQIFMSQAFSMLRNHMDTSNSDECSISIKFDSREWEVVGQNVAEKTCIQHLLECIVNSTPIEETLQIGKEKGLIGLDKKIKWHGYVRLRTIDQKRFNELYLILVPGKLLLFKNFDIIGKHVCYVTSLLGASVQMLPEENEFQVSVPGSKTLSFISSDVADAAWITELETSIDYANQAAAAAEMAFPSARKKRTNHGSKMYRVQWNDANICENYQLKSSGYGDANTQIELGPANQKFQPHILSHDVSNTDNNLSQELHFNKYSRINRDSRVKDPKNSSNAMLCLENALNEMNMAITYIKTGKKQDATWQMSPSRPNMSLQDQHDMVDWQCQSNNVSDSVDAFTSPRRCNTMASDQFSKNKWDLSSPTDLGENLQSNQVSSKSHRLDDFGNAAENFNNNQVMWKNQRLGDSARVGESLQNNQVVWNNQRLGASGCVGTISRDHEASRRANPSYARLTLSTLASTADKQETANAETENYGMTPSDPEEHQYAQTRRNACNESSEATDNACNTCQKSVWKTRHVPRELGQIHQHSNPTLQFPQGKMDHVYQKSLSGTEFQKQQYGPSVLYNHATKNTQQFMTTSQQIRNKVLDVSVPRIPRLPLLSQNNAAGLAEADCHVACKTTFPYNRPKNGSNGEQPGTGNRLSTGQKGDDMSESRLPGSGDYAEDTFSVPIEGLSGKTATVVSSRLLDQQSPSSDCFSPLERISMFQQQASSQFMGTADIKQKEAQLKSQQQPNVDCSPRQSFPVVTCSGKSIESSKSRKWSLESSKQSDIYSANGWQNGACPNEYQEMTHRTEIDLRPSCNHTCGRAPITIQDSKTRSNQATDQAPEAAQGLSRSTLQAPGMNQSAMVHRQGGQYQVNSREIQNSDSILYDKVNRNPIFESAKSNFNSSSATQINVEMTGSPMKNMIKPDNGKGEVLQSVQKNTFIGNSSALCDAFMPANPNVCLNAIPGHDLPRVQTQAVLNQQFYSQVCSEVRNLSPPVSCAEDQFSEIAAAAGTFRVPEFDNVNTLANSDHLHGPEISNIHMKKNQNYFVSARAAEDFQRSDLMEGAKSSQECFPTDQVSEIAELVNKLVRITTGEEINLKGISIVEKGSSERGNNDVQHSMKRSYDLHDKLPVMNEAISLHKTSQGTVYQMNNHNASVSKPQVVIHSAGSNSIGDINTSVQVQYMNILTGDRSSSSCPITLKSADGEVIILGKERRYTGAGPVAPKEATEGVHLINERKQSDKAQAEVLRHPRISETCSQGRGCSDNVEGDAWSLAILKPGAPAQIFKFETV